MAAKGVHYYRPVFTQPTLLADCWFWGRPQCYHYAITGFGFFCTSFLSHRNTAGVCGHSSTEVTAARQVICLWFNSATKFTLLEDKIYSHDTNMTLRSKHHLNVICYGPMTVQHAFDKWNMWNSKLESDQFGSFISFNYSTSSLFTLFRVSKQHVMLRSYQRCLWGMESMQRIISDRSFSSKWKLLPALLSARSCSQVKQKHFAA